MAFLATLHTLPCLATALPLTYPASCCTALGGRLFFLTCANLWAGKPGLGWEETPNLCGAGKRRRHSTTFVDKVAYCWILSVEGGMLFTTRHGRRMPPGGVTWFLSNSSGIIWCLCMLRAISAMRICAAPIRSLVHAGRRHAALLASKARERATKTTYAALTRRTYSALMYYLSIVRYDAFRCYGLPRSRAPLSRETLALLVRRLQPYLATPNALAARH